MKNNIYIASDHAGFEMKQAIISSKKLSQYNFIDLGTYSKDSVDYPDYAEKLAFNVLKNNALGIGICGTGIGISVALNKIDGIIAALVTDPKIAHLACEHNNANVIALSGRYVSIEKNIKIIQAFLSSSFDSRHLKRINKIYSLEKKSKKDTSC